MKQTRIPSDRKRRAIALTLALVFLVACGGTEVETVRPHRRAITESFSEPTKTRLRHTYPITMHVTARVGRIDLEPGDRIAKGQELAPVDLTPLELDVERTSAAVSALNARIAVKNDNRLENSALEELTATVRAVGEAVKAASSRVDAEQASYEHAQRNLERIEELAKAHTVAADRLDDARLQAATSLTSLREQQFTHAASRAMLAAVSVGPRAVGEYIARKTLERRTLEEQRAEAVAQLEQARHQLKIARVTSPVDGIVLERYERGDTLLEAGRRLLLVGNLDELEAEAEVLSENALQLKAGAKVEYESSSRVVRLSGSVRRIEPYGFTKLSSLGVEQQRVKVQSSIDNPPENLGVGYRLHARYTTGSRSDALVVPRRTVLQRPDGAFYVLVVAKGRLEERTVEIGLRNDLDLEIAKGLSEDDEVVARPGTRLEAGMKVSARPAQSEGDQ